jgi:hypothetical protein
VVVKHAPGTKILMADNTIKNVEDIKPDDYVMGDDLKKRKVKCTFKGHQDMYNIKLDNGESFDSK